MAPQPVLDVRLYRNVSRRRDEFVELMSELSVPLLVAAGIDVVSYGPSLIDDAHSFLIRRFETVAQRDSLLGRFYGDETWQAVHEPRVMELIESYTTVVIRDPAGLVE